MKDKTESWKKKVDPALVTIIKTLLSIFDQATIAKEKDLHIMYEQINKSNLKSFATYYDGGVMKHILSFMPNIVDFLECIEKGNKKKTIDLANKLRYKANPETILLVHFIVMCIVSAMAHKKPIKVLYEEAKGGSLDSLYKLLQIDKTVIEHEWFQDLVMRATITDDIKFFIKIGNAIKTEPPIGRLKHNRLEMILFLFWPLGMKNLSNPQLVEFLEQCGFKIHEDIESFRKRIRRPVQSFYKQYNSIY